LVESRTKEKKEKETELKALVQKETEEKKRIAEVQAKIEAKKQMKAE